MVDNIKEFQKEFCANTRCPNHLLPMTDDRHYHSSDKGVYTTEEIIYTVPYSIINPIRRRRFFRTKTEYKTKTIYLCEICGNAVDIISAGKELKK
jgi:hypothetical protein